MTQKSNKPERRHLLQPQSKAGIQTRADGKKIIAGYAAVFYREGDASTEFELWEGVYERIMPGAFDNALARPDDVRGLYNHNTSQVLGRNVEAGTLTLRVDNIGLWYEIDPPSWATSILESIERKDITGSSFAFDYDARTIEEVGENRYLQVTDVTLFDVGPVTYPAYTGTSTEVAKRSLDEWASEREREQQQQIADAQRARRLRLADIDSRAA